jgi:hypothetical protein
MGFDRQRWNVLSASQTNGKPDFTVDVENRKTGQYPITFKVGFNTSSTIAITGNQILYGNGENTRDNVIFPYFGTDNGEYQVTAETGDENGNPTDRSFSFIAYGNLMNE